MGRWGDKEDVGGVGGGEKRIKIYCIEISINSKISLKDAKEKTDYRVLTILYSLLSKAQCFFPILNKSTISEPI